MKSKRLLFFSFIRGRTFSLLKRILIIVVLVTAAFAAYEYIVVRVKGYPRDMHLMDRQYRIIPIHLEKRTATHLHITRRDTQRFYIYKIEDLHPMSQWQIQLYPTTSNLTEPKERDNGHHVNTLAARDRLIEANKKLQAKIDATESDIEIRSLEREVERNLERILKLEASLRTHAVDFKPYKHVENAGGLVERLSGLLDRIANRDDPSAE
jgi:hypothetical protein